MMKNKIFNIIFSLCFIFHSINVYAYKITVISQDKKKFNIFTEKFKSYGNDKYNIEVKNIERDYPQEQYDKYLKTTNPDLVVLVDNVSLELHKKFNQDNKMIKGVSVLSLSVSNSLEDSKGIMGIRYEVPLFSIISSFNFVFKKKIKKIACIFRNSFSGDQIELAKKHLSLTGVKLDFFDVDSSGQEITENGLSSIIDKIKKDKKYDAIWVTLDAKLFTQKLFSNFWLPISKNVKIPFITNESFFASKEINFATLAVSPNIYDLSDQAFQLVRHILQGKVNLTDLKIEENISVNTYVNTLKARLNNLEVRDNLSKTEVYTIE